VVGKVVLIEHKLLSMGSADYPRSSTLAITHIQN
jgi:hypothetical protein